MELRNPFGLQNGRIIMIEDIDKAHNGLRCNCVCPACKEPFIARIGDVKQHHFAHSGKGCDEINAYMTGLYMLLSEYLTSNKLYLPPVIVGFELSAYAFWTQENVAEHSRLMSGSREPDRVILLYEQSKMGFDKAEIVRNNEGVPHAILAQKNDSQLAIRITPPDTVCKAGEAKKYKDVPTLEIDLSDAEDIVSGGKKDEIFDYIKNNDSIFYWVYNPKIVKAYPEIIKRSKAYYDKAQQRIKQQEEERKKRALEEKRKIKEAEEYRKKWLIEHADEIRKAEEKRIQQEAEDKIRIETQMKRMEEQKFYDGFEEVKNSFNQQEKIIRDKYGIRWIQCERCGKIGKEGEFVSYGGKNHVNLGVCKKCNNGR